MATGCALPRSCTTRFCRASSAPRCNSMLSRSNCPRIRLLARQCTSSCSRWGSSRGGPQHAAAATVADGMRPRPLERSFDHFPQELKLEHDKRFRVIVKDGTLPLNSNICGPLYGIGREALVNAFQQCEATEAEVELRYRPSEFRLTVRHDGDDRAVFVDNIAAMRERAAGIGARLQIRNRVRGGMEIKVSVPAHAAFESPHSERASIWRTGFRRRRPLLERADANAGRGR